MQPARAPSAVCASTLAPPPPLHDGCALFLDVDGCLLEFATDPDEVTVEASLLACLSHWRARLDGALALVSGRSLSTLDRLFAPLQLPAAGLHGLERRHGDLRSDTIDVPVARLRMIQQGARAIAAKYPGTLVEDKGASLAFHWRADPQAAPDFEACAAAAAMTLPNYHLQHGDHVVELRPVGGDKGSAVAAFLDEPPFAGRWPVFAGDDLTDEAGFAAVNAHGGISIRVGHREPTCASHGLPSPAAVRAWLGCDGKASPA